MVGLIVVDIIGVFVDYIEGNRYRAIYGPTKGDRFRLADTDLIVEIENDLGTIGDEAIFGGGKSIRDGMGQAPSSSTEGALDLVITGVVVMDPKLGIIKGDIGIKEGQIVGVGKAGNPNTMDGVSPDLVIGSNTEVLAGEHMIATPGGIDSHIHFIDPAQVYEALSSGITTMLGGGTGPVAGTAATTCTPGVWNMHRMLQAAEAFPVNLGFLGKGNTTSVSGLEEQIQAGAIGLKIHEDWGSTPAVINASLEIADQFDVQVAIHTDTLNESGFVEDTIAAIAGRVIHTYHTEGAGGGHAPDILKIASEPNVLPSSTNPTRPYSVNTIDEHLDMLMVCHHLNPSIPEDLAFAESRIRPETIAAEDVLHDRGVISMYSSDSQAMGRVGENWQRLFQTADKMKKMTGSLSQDSNNNDNFRILRYLAKLTINPAIAHGISHEVGSISPGKLADIVIWEIPFFAIRPKFILKGGIVSWSASGDPGASIPTPQPMFYRPMFGSYGRAISSTCLTFVSKAALENNIGQQLGLKRRLSPVENCRSLTKSDMIRNDSVSTIEVNPQTYQVYLDGELIEVEPAEKLSLAQLYKLI